MTDAIEYVRVKDPVTGHQYTTSKTDAENSGLEILDKPAVDQIGRPLPTKHHTGKAPARSVKSESTSRGSQSGPEAATKEES